MATTEKPFIQKKDIPHTIVGMILRGFGLGFMIMGVLVFALGHDTSISSSFTIIEAILCFGFGLGLHGIHTIIYLLIDIKDALQESK
jgi:hypothetical protein